MGENKLPRHVAIIMDGNGRWAKKRLLPRVAGHNAGMKSMQEIVRRASDLGIEHLTVYAFSTENWNRPPEEVAALMSLIFTSLEEELFMRNNVRLRIVGDLGRLPEDVRTSLEDLTARTAENSGMSLVLALSYSARWEITEAARKIAARTAKGELTLQDITEKTITEALTTSFMPDPDLLIRTGGELRLSNYLLWQCAYSELYFCDTFWPDFNEEAFYAAVADYQSRERRFGKTSRQVEQTTEK